MDVGKIEFLVQPSVYGVVPEPYPASKHMPDWFRKLPAYPESLRPEEYPIPTAKRCVPLKDMLAIGYIIPLPWAVRVYSDEEGGLQFSWNGDPNSMFGAPIEKHAAEQASGYPSDVQVTPFKFNNPWIIKTPPGWSTLFLPLPNRGETRFEIFAGVVDTDVYYNGINFPFLWKEYPHDAVLDAGTPIAQAIPFKRNDTEFVARAMTEEEEGVMHKQIARLHSHQHYYAREIRHNNKRETKEETILRGCPITGATTDPPPPPPPPGAY